MKSISNICVFILFLCKFGMAQDHGFFNQIWLEDGLSQSSISSIVQDKKGLIWFGTQDGLNKYDGRLIEHYNFKPFDSKTISGDDITNFCTLNNALYIISAGGLDKIDLSTETVVHLKEQYESKEKPSVLAKIWNVNDRIFLFTSKGLAEINATQNTYSISAFEFIDDKTVEFRTFVFSLCSDSLENLYAATNKGIYMAIKNSKEFKPLIEINALIQSKSTLPVESNFIFAKNNKLYFSVGNSFYVYNFINQKIKSFVLNSIIPSVIKNCIIDEMGHPWIGTNGSGLFRLGSIYKDSLYIEKSFVKNSNERFGLKSNDITSLYQNPNSQEGMLWIGTRDAGAFNYSYSKNSFDLASSVLKNNEPNFFGVVKDTTGIIWAAFNDGILKIDRKNKSYQTINLATQLSKTNRFIEAIYCDKENEIWTGFGNSLYKINKKKNSLNTVIEQIYPGKRNHVVKIVPKNDEELIVCCTQGICIYNFKTNTSHFINEISLDGEHKKIENPNSFFIDSKNNWWLGSAKGLYYINTKNNSGKFYTHQINDTNSLVSSRIMDINELLDGRIIIATTKGLSIIEEQDKSTRFKNYHNVKGLSNNFIYGLLRDEKGNFWMSTNFGIAIFNPIKESFKSYSASDGVCINEFNSAGFHRAYDGELLFGGIGALVSIYPSRQVINKNVPDVFLKSLKIENYYDSINPQSNSIQLAYNQNKINIEFVVPDFSGVNNINLFYRFTPNNKWTKINSSQVFSLYFAKLAPGNYNLEVIAVNSEGIESTPLTYTFVISPPFWNTWWFFLFILVIVVLITWAIYQIRLKAKIEHIKELENIRKEENEKVRKAAALDLHDEFGNGLTRISMLIEMARIHTPKENLEANSILDVISQNSQRLYQGTKDFIWSINPGNDNVYEIIIRLKDYADELFYGTGYTFELKGLNDELKNFKQLPSAGRNITMIFKEALSNIAKHAQASHVKLMIHASQNSVSLTLIDNGIGFENKVNKNSFGLSNMQQRANRLGSELIIQSELKKGTQISLTINKLNIFSNHEN